MSAHNELTDTQDGMDHGTVKSYIIGFILSLALTFTAFTLVADHLLSSRGLYMAITGLALGQLFIQLVFFLHLNTKSAARWNLVAFLFTTVVVCILAAGSLWIMYNLNYNMMMN